MSDVRFLTYPVFQAFDDNGNPLSGGKVNVYSEGTTDRIDTWTNATQNTKNANPVILNSRGEAEIWFDAPVKIVLTDSSDVTVKTIDSVSPLNAQTITGKYNLLENGSFELDGDGDGKPDSWDIVETDGSSTVEIDTSTVAHGSNSLKFVSGSGGGGTATTSEKFPVSDGESFGVSFFVASTATTATNKVDVIFYDSAGTNPSTTNIYTSGGTSPSSLTRKSFSASVPAGKSQAEVKLTGVDNAVTATTYFDFVQALDQGYIFTGTAGEVTASAAELNKTSHFTNIDGEVTATDEELNKLDGFTGELTSMGYWELIEKKTPSGASTLDFTTGIDSGHNRYKLVFIDLTVTTTNTILLNTSTDGGSSYDSGASDYVWVTHLVNTSGTESIGNSTGDSKISLNGGAQRNGEVTFTRGGGSLSPSFSTYLIATSSFTTGFGKRDNTTAIDALQLSTNSTDTFDSGSVALYGWVDGS